MNDMKISGTVFDITHYMIEDGTGIRTNVFLKGCPLRCLWCSNAYGLGSKVQMGFVQERCTGCGKCLNVCPYNAIKTDENVIVTNFNKCRNCLECVSVCPSKARRQIGRVMTVDEVVREVEKDRIFYRRGNGGVTLSGGEIMMQPTFAKEILSECKKRFINTAVETSAMGRWEDLEKILYFCDQVFIDCKAIDSTLHKKLTGVDNQIIIENIKKAADYCVQNSIKLIIRLPLIPGKNDGRENILMIGHFVRELCGKPLLNILPYHNYGVNKYAHIGQKYDLEELLPPDRKQVMAVRGILDDVGVNYSVGGYNI